MATPWAMNEPNPFFALKGQYKYVMLPFQGGLGLAFRYSLPKALPLG